MGVSRRGAMRRGVVAACVVLVAVVGLVAGCAAEEPAAGKARAEVDVPAEEGKAGQHAASKDAKILESGFADHEVWGPGAYVVKYEITNRGKGRANYFVGLEFLDKDGDVLGSTGVGADKLGPGKTKVDDTAPLPVEIENGPMKSIVDVRVSTVERTPVE
jgi:hypothetical protein